MMTEIITGFYALFACITFAFLLWDECPDEFDHDAEDLGVITLSAVFWLPLVVAFLIDFWRKWVNRG
ncbi:hypothetical protein ACSOOX_002621 [Escherichia coli]|uniref:hypothetical protein n=1 Tax=Escherichia coli TaxID=562 RepID=UPI000CDA400C|nr:hypothetical protein [Escherichia coli]EEW1891868.1 hypothetical protein [Escherichia coli]EFH7978691.1 hypothetical protein [Escherichia coli]EFL4103164.1 hypothetical protein [Escherichia coli]EFT2739485.1 hypothetical protein [Escherichia coli]EHH8101904.1 hypothetical protein [Escherichia coli]